MSIEHLRERRKLTLYVPHRFIPYVEMAAKLAEKEGKSLGLFIWEALAEKLERERSKAGKLKGVLRAYAIGRRPDFKGIREKVKEEVARDVAEEGVADRR